MPNERHILLVAKAAAPWLGAVRACASSAGWPVSVQEKTLDALTWLDDNVPRAIVIDSTVPRALTLCVLARAKPSLVDIPILGLVPVVDQASFSRWLAVGVDDVLPAAAPTRLVDRLRSMPADGSVRPAPDRGRAVVADTDPARCDVIGRVLGYAGYSVRLALDVPRLLEYGADPDVQLVVASTTVGEPVGLIKRVRRGATLPAWVVGDPALEPWANPRPFAKLERAVVMSARAQPDAFLFASNALLLASGRKARGSPRLLYGTTVLFRGEEEAPNECGYTFNVSATGLFIRSLLPPSPGNVLIELTPPGSRERLKLEGEVIWTRPFGNQPGATAPPGFGVQLLDDRTGALDRWQKAYTSLASSSGVPAEDERQPPAKSEPGELKPAIMKASQPSPMVEPVTLEAPPELPLTASTESVQPAEDTEDTETSPASLGAAAPTSTSRRRRPWLLTTFAFVATIVAGVGLWVFVGERDGETPPPVSTPSASVPPKTVRAQLPTDASSEPIPSPSSVQRSELAAASAIAPSPPASIVPSAESGACPTLPSDAGQGLLSFQGYLIVCSTASLDVYASGVLVGKTNEKLVSRCRLKYVRLGEGEPPVWRSEGKTVDVACRGVTRITIEPSDTGLGD